MKDKKEVILIIDLEFTCWMGRPPKGMIQEIIEIGVSQIDLRTKEIEKVESILIKPEKSVVSSFCKKLTGISQRDVYNKGISLKEACEHLMAHYISKEIVWGSWGDFDEKQFKRECLSKVIDYPFSDLHIDLQKEFSNLLKTKRLYGLTNALSEFDLEFEGRPHSAKYDSYNTARLYLNMII
jgi:inhibitor of KinA sporulation pathway (predicted exonuclease)